jgi:hypothetical protein
MSQISGPTSGSGGGGTVNSLTPDSGAPVTPIAGTIDITGYPQTSGGVKGIKTFNGGTNIFQISNLDAVTPYMVGKTANTSAFSTIQSAINQAVSDGADAASPAVVWVTPGIYTENLTLSPFVHLTGTGSGLAIQIEGNATYTSANNGDQWSCTNISFVSTNSSPALTLAGSAISDVNLNLVDFNSGSANGIAFQCSGSGISAQLQGCTLEAASGGRCLNMSAGAVEIFSCISIFTDTASTISGGTLKVASSDITDSFTLTSTGISEFFESAINSGSLVCMNLNGAGTTGACLNTVLTSSGAFYISGTGQFVYSNIASSSGLTIQNTVVQVPLPTLTGNISFDGGTTLLNQDGQVWIGSSAGIPVPTTITAGAGISVTNGHNSITIAATNASAFTSITVQTFTSSGTYTPTAGMLYCTIEVVGGGGGGGGAPATGVTTAAAGGGGGGGGYARKTVTAATIGASKVVTVGTGGAGGVGNSPGTAGVTSSVGAIVTASGGGGGGNAAAAVATTATGGMGGAGGSGDINIYGGTGASSFGVGSTLGAVTGGSGGTTYFGGGGNAPATTSAAASSNGLAGQAYGSGGSGAISLFSGAAATGGAGSSGVVIITEYI